jgi:Kef-type K+ transport system membrane component KefB/uncharacterized UPF0146 family protein
LHFAHAHLAQSASTGAAGLSLLIVVATAAAVALVFGRFGLPPAPGYLIAGAIIGPSGIGLINAGGVVAGLAQLSTILFLFIIGLQLDMSRVRLGFLSIIWAACAATALMTLIGWPIAKAFVGNAPAALVVAMAMSIAATAVPLKTLETRRELHTTYGRLAFGITLFQDLLAVGMLALLPALALWAGVRTGEERELLQVVGSGALSIAGLVVLVLLGRVVFPRLLLIAGRMGSEVLIVSAAAVALGAAGVSHLLGFSPELGAFLAGFLLAGTTLRHQIAGQLIPLRDLFLAVFFTTIGMSIPLAPLMDGWWIVIAGVIALGVVKVVGIAVASWVLGATPRFGLLAAVTLAPAGEFSLVMLSQARAVGVLSDSALGYTTAVVGLSIIGAPIIVRFGHRAKWVERIPLAPWGGQSHLRRGTESQPAPPKTAPHAIIGGFGPVGRAVADRLEREGIRVTVVELNPRTVERQERVGRKVIYGDVSNPEVLLSAGLEQADAVILTAPDQEAMLRACETIRSLNPRVLIAIRVAALSGAMRAKAVGADVTVVEEIVTAEAMAEHIARSLPARRITPSVV